MPGKEYGAELDDYARTAHTLVDSVIEKAIQRLAEEDESREAALAALKEDLLQERTVQYATPPPQEDFEVQNIEWLNIGEFSPEKAENKITQFIETWNYEESWQYCIDYLGADEHEFDTRHRYRVRWSIPTRRKPIPRATASVYFTFEVSRIKPKNFPVDVYYVFETNRLVHRPGHSRFREKWLKDIIESKVITLDAIDF